MLQKQTEASLLVFVENDEGLKKPYTASQLHSSHFFFVNILE